jgi:hypothetical protein
MNSSLANRLAWQYLPPHSWDLTLLSYHIWSHMQKKMYECNVLLVKKMPGHIKERKIMYYSISSTALVNHNEVYGHVARQQPQNKPLLISSFADKHVLMTTIDLQQ